MNSPFQPMQSPMALNNRADVICHGHSHNDEIVSMATGMAVLYGIWICVKNITAAARNSAVLAYIADLVYFESILSVDILLLSKGLNLC